MTVLDSLTREESWFVHLNTPKRVLFYLCRFGLYQQVLLTSVEPVSCQKVIVSQK